MFKSVIFCLACTLSGLLYADSEVLAGGYHTINLRDPYVQDAATFAAAQINQGPLIAVLAAESQVVAGTNYHLVLEIVGNDGLNHTFDVVVFMPLPVYDQPMQLTSYQDLGTVNSKAE